MSKIHQKKVHVIVIVFTLLFSGAALYSSDAQYVKLELVPSQEGITEFRYQLGGEDEALWQRVDAADPVITIDTVDRSQPFELFVQQSPDGKLWSGSVVSRYDPADQEIKFAGFTPGKPYTSQPLDETRFGIELFGGLGIKTTPFPVESTVKPAVTLDFVFDNLVQTSNMTSIGLRLGTAFDINTTTANANSIYFHDLHLIPKLNIRLGSFAAADIGLGASAVFMNYMSKGSDDFLRDGNNDVVYYMLGPTFQFNLRLNIDRTISLGLQYEGRLSFVDYFDSYELTSFVRAGMGFRL